MKTILIAAFFAASMAAQFTPPSGGGGGGTGTVTNVSAASLSPLFTTSVGSPTTTPSIAFSLTNAGQNTIFGGPPTGGAGAPSYQTAPTISAANMTNFPTFNQNTTGTAGGLSSVLTEASGGTGANNTVGAAGHMLRSNGTHYVDSAIQSGDVPTLNQNTSGNAANLSGTPALPNGTTATTQSQADGTTKLATNAYVDTGLGTKAASNAATTVNGQTCTLGSTCTIPLSAINAQTATYQVLAGDFSNYKTITVASGTFTITLVASGTQPAAGQYINIVNYGSGVVTVARSGQNINGGTASLTLAAASATAPTSTTVYSDGTNYFASLGGASSSGAITVAQGSISSIPSCTSVLNEIYYPTDSFASQALCLTGASSWTYLLNGMQIFPLTTGNWSTLGSGCTVTTLTNAMNVASSTGGSGNICGTEIATVGTSYTHFILLYPQVSQANFSTIGVEFTDGTKTEGVQLIFGATTAQVTIASGKSSALVAGTYASAVGDSGNGFLSATGQPLWVKLVRNSSTLSGFASIDGGLSYVQLFNDTSPFLTPTNIVVYTDPRGAAGVARTTVISYQ